MHQSNAKIIDTMREIIFLLRVCSEKRWSRILNVFLFECYNTKNEDQVIKKIINIYQGGMGSFNDLVLHKDRKMLMDENEKLEKLRRDLYIACENFLKTNPKQN